MGLWMDEVKIWHCSAWPVDQCHRARYPGAIAQYQSQSIYVRYIGIRLYGLAAQEGVPLTKLQQGHVIRSQGIHCGHRRLVTLEAGIHDESSCDVVLEETAVAEDCTCPNCSSNCWTRLLAAASSFSARSIRCRCPRVACSCSPLRHSCKCPISPSITSSSWSGEGAAASMVSGTPWTSIAAAIEAVVEAAVIHAVCPHTSTSKMSSRNPGAYPFNS